MVIVYVIISLPKLVVTAEVEAIGRLYVPREAKREFFDRVTLSYEAVLRSVIFIKNL